MQQIKDVWTVLSLRKRVIVGLATLLVFIGVLAMARMATSPSMKLLYSGLENGAAGDVVSALEQRGALYEVRGGAIYVDAARRDELRMTLASDGLPANGGRGYELLDSLNGFGTTSQMFDAAYWRAKEGELARTILANLNITQARVHIAHGENGPFRRDVEPTASVSIVTPGAGLTPDQARALKHLVASAVSGLAMANVVLVDANGALLGTADAQNTPSTGDDRAQALRDRVLRLVEARVGRGRAVVEVSVDTVTETESIRERIFDPDSRVAISTDTEERSNSSNNQAGEVTVASNLPDGPAESGDGTSARTSETRERVNYEVSETEREILRAPGAIRRLSVAVLVDGVEQTDAQGVRSIVPRPQEEMTALRALVESAVGYDDERGDVITLQSMELPAIELPGSVARPSTLGSLGIDAMALIQVGALMLVTMALGLFVVRPILTSAPRTLPPSPVLNGPEPKSSGPLLTGEIDDDPNSASDVAPRSLTNGRGNAVARISASPDTVDRLRAMIGERQEETVEILRSWLDEKKEKAG